MISAREATRRLHRNPCRTTTTIRVAIAAVLVLSGACASTTVPLAPPPISELRDTLGSSYAIHVGDVLGIQFYTAPELNAEVPVRSDGFISVEPIGDVHAAGVSPAVLAEQLRSLYAEELRQPDVTVVVKKFGGQVYVVGEVGKPAALAFATGMTALQAISGVGGFLDSAQTDSVVLIRQRDDRPVGYRLALQKALSGEDRLADVPVRPSDIIYVPRSAIGNVNSFVRRYLRDNIPVRMGVGATTNF